MYPVNQVFLGNDPLLNSSNSINNMQNIEEQLKLLENQRLMLENALQKMQTQNQTQIWNTIDQEINPLTNDLKSMLFLNEEYAEIYNLLLAMVLSELLNLVKGKIENSKEGNELLNRLLKLVKKLKSGIIDSTNREMETFKRFKEFSKLNPDLTYEEFMKQNTK